MYIFFKLFSPNLNIKHFHEEILIGFRQNNNWSGGHRDVPALVQLQNLRHQKMTTRLRKAFHAIVIIVPLDATQGSI